MICFCCGTEMQVARKVKSRRLPDLDIKSIDISNVADRIVYKELGMYRWGVVCGKRYWLLDKESDCGDATIAGEFFTLAGASRHDKARRIGETDYWKWQQKEAKKLGVDLTEGGRLSSMR
jgi:hypothetical protein